MNFSDRKHPRLKNYDYSQSNGYFVTFCVKDMKNLLGTIHVGRDAHIPPQVNLSYTGKIAEKYILNIPKVYSFISVEKYVIMPNHIHMLMIFSPSNNNDGGMWASRPTLSTVIRSLKTMVTKEIGYSIWQNSFYDRIIQSEQEFFETWQYIEENPLRYVLKNFADYNYGNKRISLT